MLDNLLAGDPVRALPNPLRGLTIGEWYPQNPWYVLPILAVAILATLIADRFRPLRALLLTAGIWVAFSVACVVAFVWARLWAYRSTPAWDCRSPNRLDSVRDHTFRSSTSFHRWFDSAFPQAESSSGWVSSFGHWAPSSSATTQIAPAARPR